MTTKSKLEKMLNKNDDIIINKLTQEMELTAEKAAFICKGLNVPYEREEDKVVDLFIAKELLYCLEDYVVCLMRKLRNYDKESTKWLEVKTRIEDCRKSLSKTLEPYGSERTLSNQCHE